MALGLFEAVLLAASALAAGILAPVVWASFRRRRFEHYLDRIQSRSIRNPEYGQPGEDAPAEASSSRTCPSGAIFVESITIRNFKNISELRLDLMRPSTLSGQWTCIAGINGAGKSSILQAVCLALLGGEHVNELGRGRLGRLLRRSDEGTLAAEIEVFVLRDGRRTRLYLPLAQYGVHEAAVDIETLRAQPDYAAMKDMWRELRGQVVVSYGASRNLSDVKDSRLSNFSRVVQRQMTLFDPLTQLASVEVVLEGGEKARPVIESLYQLVRVVLSGEALQPQSPASGDKLRFTIQDTVMDVIDLPDGFRSTVAWLADLCAAWHEGHPGGRDVKPAAITGIVLLDEIGLHLHPSLEKGLVPQLRRALPRVQFLVSTHSPLVLSSFDRDELVILDAASPGGTRQLDRQLFGMTMDDVYAWLMNTSPASRVMEEMLAGTPDSDAALFLYQSKNVNEELASKLIEERQHDIERLEREKHRQ